MTQQNTPTKCPKCGSDSRSIRISVGHGTGDRILSCDHPWHRNPAAPPVHDPEGINAAIREQLRSQSAAPPGGETDVRSHHHNSNDSSPASSNVGRALQATVASPAMSTANVYEVKPDSPPPSCHACGAMMIPTEWKCSSCGTTTSPTAAPPAGMTAAEQLPWDEEDEQLLATSNGNVDLIAHLRGEVERVTRERDDLLAKLGKCLTPTGEAIERNRKRRARAALESTTPREGK